MFDTAAFQSEAPKNTFFQRLKTGHIFGSVPTILLALVVGVGLLYFVPSFFKSRTVSVAGTAQKTLPVNKIAFTIQYSRVGADKAALVLASDAAFQDIANQLSKFNSVQLSESGSQTLLSNNQYIYRKVAKITLNDKLIYPQVQGLLGDPNISVIQTVFLSDQEPQLKNDLIVEAIADAKRKAAQVALAARGRLGRITTVTEVTPENQASNLLSSNKQDVDQTEQTTELRSSVLVTFELY